MSKNMLKAKLQEIEHAYFCYEKDCPLCDGTNFYLKQKYNNINHKTVLSKSPGKGEIWKIATNYIYPVYVLVLKDYGFFKSCIKVSEFIEFKSQNDLVKDDWLFECWNKINILNKKFEKKIETIEKNLLKKINKLSKQEIALKQDDILILLFQNLEKEYINETIIKSTSEEFEHIKKEQLTIIDKIKGKLKDFEFKIPVNSEPDLSFGARKSTTGSKIFEKFTKIFVKKRTNISNYMEISTDYLDNDIEVTIKQKFSLLPDNIIARCNKKKIKVDIQKIDLNNIIFTIPFYGENIEIILEYPYNKKLVFEIEIF